MVTAADLKDFVAGFESLEERATKAEFDLTKVIAERDQATARIAVLEAEIDRIGEFRDDAAGYFENLLRPVVRDLAGYFEARDGDDHPDEVQSLPVSPFEARKAAKAPATVKAVPLVYSGLSGVLTREWEKVGVLFKRAQAQGFDLGPQSIYNRLVKAHARGEVERRGKAQRYEWRAKHAGEPVETLEKPPVNLAEPIAAARSNDKRSEVLEALGWTEHGRTYDEWRERLNAGDFPDHGGLRPFYRDLEGYRNRLQKAGLIERVTGGRGMGRAPRFRIVRSTMPTPEPIAPTGLDDLRLAIERVTGDAVSDNFAARTPVDQIVDHIATVMRTKRAPFEGGYWTTARLRRATTLFEATIVDWLNARIEDGTVERSPPSPGASVKYRLKASVSANAMSDEQIVAVITTMKDRDIYRIFGYFDQRYCFDWQSLWTRLDALVDSGRLICTKRFGRAWYDGVDQ